MRWLFIITLFGLAVGWYLGQEEPVQEQPRREAIGRIVIEDFDRGGERTHWEK